MLKSMYAFALGAASCGTSVESSLENKSEMGKDRSSQLSSACALVESICLGDDDKLRCLMTLLDNSSPTESADEMRSAGSSRRSVVTCFLTLEHSSRKVLIGRKDATVPFPFVVAVPCYDAILACLAEWEQVMEMNSSQLSRTKDPIAVKTWSNEDKATWWRDRDALDDRIQDYLREVQATLGVWRCLLVPTCLHGSSFSKDIDDKLRTRICTLARECGAAKPKATKKSVKITNTKKNMSSVNVSGDDDIVFWDDDASASAKVTVLMKWIHIISESGVLTSDEQIEAFFQVLTFFLMSRGVVGAEAAVRTEATEIWEILFSFKQTEANENQLESHSSKEHPPDSVGYDEETDRQRLEGLKVPELRKLLKAHHQESSGKKSELVDRMCGFYAEQHAAAASTSSSEATGGGRSSSSLPSPPSQLPSVSRGNHVVLILDELLQSIPLENIPLLRHKEVSRVPGLTVLVNLMLLHTPTHEQLIAQSPTKQIHKQTQEQAQALAHGSSSSSSTREKMLSLARCWYSIDPDANLLDTRTTMRQFMQPYAAKWGWTGFVGEKPPSSAIK